MAEKGQITLEQLAEFLEMSPRDLNKALMQGLGALEKPEFLTVDDVAQEFGITKDAIRKSIHQDGMPCRKVGNQWRFSREGLHAWLSSGNLETERARRASMRGDADENTDAE